jgi:predicted small metal-binding protein
LSGALSRGVLGIPSHEETAMSLQLACADVMPGCPAVVTGETEDEIMSQAGQHAAADHGVTNPDEETLAAIRGAIRPRS